MPTTANIKVLLGAIVAAITYERQTYKYKDGGADTQLKYKRA